ncbi:hypothetical protein INT45_010013 [Circinella minor]|uniref:Uncharacterized protein n=1 Tax=Circinella minor TaxID=1195481 RepID=A0A8H7S6I0_9FUNG|nr:hypothetical protein INT45_010013 [Circinella minor]
MSTTTINALDTLEHTIIDLSTIVNDKNSYIHRRHKSLPPSPPPPQLQPANNRDDRYSLSDNNLKRHVQNKNDNIKLFPTTEDIINEINYLADDVVKTAESRVEHFRREYNETVYQLESLKRKHHRILQQLREQQENDRIKTEYYQDLLRRQAKGEFISPSCYSTPSISSSKKSKKL